MLFDYLVLLIVYVAFYMLFLASKSQDGETVIFSRK